LSLVNKDVSKIGVIYRSQPFIALLRPKIVSMTDAWEQLPGYELVSGGLADLAAGRESEASLVVTMAAPRLRSLGIAVPAAAEGASHRLYELLSERDDGAHSRYNALVGRMVSFARAAERASAG
jgi:F0F1-type ATP synthase epsilon subunit